MASETKYEKQDPSTTEMPAVCERCQEADGPYTEQVMAHFMNPRNIGTLENPDGMGTCGDPCCGDCLVMHLQIRDGTIDTVRYLVLGCAAAIADYRSHS